MPTVPYCELCQTRHFYGWNTLCPSHQEHLLWLNSTIVEIKKILNSRFPNMQEDIELKLANLTLQPHAASKVEHMLKAVYNNQEQEIENMLDAISLVGYSNDT